MLTDQFFFWPTFHSERGPGRIFINKKVLLRCRNEHGVATTSTALPSGQGASNPFGGHARACVVHKAPAPDRQFSHDMCTAAKTRSPLSARVEERSTLDLGLDSVSHTGF